MESLSVDRRIVRTEEAIEKAFIEIVKEKGFESTRISDIVTRSNINRSTFYLHYLDKFDLLEKLTTRTVNGLNKQVIRAKAAYRQDSDAPEDAYKRLYILFLAYMKNNRDLIQILLTFGGNNSLRHRLLLLMQENVSSDQYPTTLNLNNEIPISYFSSYFVNADLGVMEQWLDGGCKESIEEVASFMTSMFFSKNI